MKTENFPMLRLIAIGRSVLDTTQILPDGRLARVAQAEKTAPRDFPEAIAMLPALLQLRAWALENPEALALLLRTPSGTAVAARIARGLE